tara:strand:+ start:152 stop:499 length:348 start_codon:yes stop_codon:yes gene_type:complete
VLKHSDKKQIIENLLIVPDKQKRLFWAKEIKMLNILMVDYPSNSFWSKISFPQKLDSLILLRSGYYKKELDKKYNRYNFKIPEEQAPVIGKKSGEDYNYKKQPQTIREFCDDENS